MAKIAKSKKIEREKCQSKKETKFAVKIFLVPYKFSDAMGFFFFCNMTSKSQQVWTNIKKQEIFLENPFFNGFKLNSFQWETKMS